MKKKIVFIIAATVLMVSLLTAGGLACNEAPKQSAVITVTNLEQTYDGTVKNVFVTMLPQNSGTVTVEYKLDGEIIESPIEAGTYDVSIKFESTTHKNEIIAKQMIISPKELTVSGVVAENKIYDGINSISFSNNGDLNGVVTGDSVYLVRLIGGGIDKNVGEGKAVVFSKIILGGADKDNYTVKNPENITVDITAKRVTLGGISIDVKEADGTTGASYTGTPILIGIEGDDVVNVEIEKFEFLDADSGRDKPMKVTATLNGTDKNNYYIEADNCGIIGIIGIVQGDFLLSANKIGEEINSYSILTYTGTDEEIIIPDTYNGKPIDTIATYAFSENQTVTQVTCPDSIKLIDEYAFWNSVIENITFSAASELTTIGYSAFSNSKIAAINIPAKVNIIQGDAFKGSELASLTFAGRDEISPLQLKIKERVFFETKLVNVTVPRYVSEIGFGCFQLSALLNEVIFEESEYDIIWGYAPDGRAWTFAWSSVKIIRFNGGITDIPKTFAQETPLHTIELSEGIERIGFCAFIFTKVQSVIIPSTVTRIQEGAFKSVDSLISVTFASGGNDALVIEEFVFYQTRITSIVIPNRVSYLGWGTFAQIPTLASIVFEEGGEIGLVIGNDAFDVCPKVTQVTLPDRVTIYADNAFDDGCVVNNGQDKMVVYLETDERFNVPN